MLTETRMTMLSSAIERPNYKEKIKKRNGQNNEGFVVEDSLTPQNQPANHEV